MVKTTIAWRDCQKESSPEVARVLYQSWHESPEDSFEVFLEQFNKEHTLNIEYSRVTNSITFEVSDHILFHCDMPTTISIPDPCEFMITEVSWSGATRRTDPVTAVLYDEWMVFPSINFYKFLAYFNEKYNTNIKCVEDTLIVNMTAHQVLLFELIS